MGEDVNVIPNTQLEEEEEEEEEEAEEMDISGEENGDEEEEEEEEPIPRAARARKHVIVSSSEEQTQTTQDDNNNNNDENKNKNKDSNSNQRFSSLAPMTTMNSSENMLPSSTDRSQSAQQNHLVSNEMRIAQTFAKNTQKGLWNYISCIKRLRKAKTPKQPSGNKMIKFTIHGWITRVGEINYKNTPTGERKWRAKIIIQDSTQYLTVFITNEQINQFASCTVAQYANYTDAIKRDVQKTFEKNCHRFCGRVQVEATKYEMANEGFPTAISFDGGGFDDSLLESLERRCELTPF